MARIEGPQRAALGPEAQEAFDHVARSRGQVGGPFGVLVHRPEVAARVSDLGAFVRFESSLPEDLRCLAVLQVARAFDCRFEWAGWTAHARAAGIAETVIDAIAAGRSPEHVTGDQALVLRFGRELLGPEHRVSDGVYSAVVSRFSEHGAIDLAVTYGYFQMLSAVLNTFEVDVPDDGDELPVR